MKMFFEQPELEIIRFDIEDVITTSLDDQALEENEMPLAINGG